MHAISKKLLIAVFPLIALAACGKEPPAAPPASTTAITDPASSTQKNESSPPAVTTYACQPDIQLSAIYSKRGEDHVVQLAINDATYQLVNTVSASGSKYATDQGRTSGKTLVWWTKNDKGTLYEGNIGGAPDDELVIAECSERMR